MISLRAGGATDVGRVRAVNEDSLLIEDAVVAVADGMGGHSGGDIASQVVVEQLGASYAEPTVDELLAAIQTANEGVIEAGSGDPTLKGMGTTLVALAVVGSDGGHHLAVANVGDSRCYLLAGDQLRQLTTDHTVVQTLVDHGEITAADAAVHPHRNVITRALGIDQRVMTDYWELRPAVGDRYLLCSDGLTGEIDDGGIASVLNEIADPEEAARALVDRAVEAGGRDNVTVVVVDVADTDGAAPADGRLLATVAGASQAAADGAVFGDAASARAEAAQIGDGAHGDDEPSRRRPGHRMILVGFVLVAVVLTVLGVVAFSGRGTYYVGFDEAEVVIYKGRPGGVLWFDPSVDSRTGIAFDDVPNVFLDELDSGEEFGSRDEAEEYVARIEVAILAVPADLPPPLETPSTPAPDVGDGASDGGDGGDEAPADEGSGDTTTTIDRTGRGVVN